MALSQKHKLMVHPKAGKVVILVISIAFIISGLRAYQLFGYVFNDNVKKDYVLLIHRGATFDMVCDTLMANDVIINRKAFAWVAKKKKYNRVVKPGRYHFKRGMNANQLVNILRSGLQEPVNVVFNNVRTREQLAGVVSKYLQADSASIIELFNKKTAEKYGFTDETFNAMFIPNTYEFYWTTPAEGFFDRMKTEFDRYWNEERRKKAENLGFSPVEVATLASIVQEETNKNDEKATVAGVYVNRLRKGMPLQADPTVKFAVGDFSLQRVLFSHLETDSPYNTYMYPGLPPGPITFPELSSLEATLNFEKHNYLFFCAREDFSGYHNFARTLAEHNRNAERYRAALNQARIFR